MAVLTSEVHGEWARGRSSTLRADVRYTPSSAFETFPWPPAPTGDKRARVAAAGVAVLDRRAEVCQAAGIGMTTLYNSLDEGAYADLRELHAELEAAVADAYGWPMGLEAAERNARLLDLNRRMTTGGREG